MAEYNAPAYEPPMAAHCPTAVQAAGPPLKTPVSEYHRVEDGAMAPDWAMNLAPIEAARSNRTTSRCGCDSLHEAASWPACTFLGCPPVVHNGQQLDQHTAVSAKQKAFQCQCGSDFTKKSALTRHVKESLGSRQNYCPFCVKTFRRIDHLNIHLNTVHKHEAGSNQAHTDALPLSFPDAVDTNEALTYPMVPALNGNPKMHNDNGTNHAGWADQVLSYNSLAYHGACPVFTGPTAGYAAVPGGFGLDRIAVPNEQGPYGATDMMHSDVNFFANNYGMALASQEFPGYLSSGQDVGIIGSQEASSLTNPPGYPNGNFGMNGSNTLGFADPYGFTGQPGFGSVHNVFGFGATMLFNGAGFGNLAAASAFPGHLVGYDGFGPDYINFTTAGSLDPQETAHSFGHLAGDRAGAHVGFSLSHDALAGLAVGGGGDYENDGMVIDDGVENEHHDYEEEI